MPGIKNKILSTFIIILFVSLLHAQDDAALTLIKKYAESSFRNGDYEFALENYKQLYESDPDNLEYQYKLGVCYTETNIDREKAIPFLEYVTSFNDIDKTAYYYLGLAYSYNYRFTEALEAFYEYKISGINDEVLANVNRLISMSYYAIEVLGQPINIKFEHLDSTINTSADEVFPFVTKDGTLLFFTSNREYIDVLEENRSSVYMSQQKKESWDYATKCDFSTIDNEEIVGISDNGETILIHIDGDFFYNDIHIIDRKGTKFTKKQLAGLPKGLNTDDVENGATITPDGNTIYFSSNRRGGFGGSDLYKITKKPDGNWSEPLNLGAVINTEYDENYPNLTNDGKTMYFASKGHDCIGGYDIFVSNYIAESETWSPPRNFGFPLNTPDDNTTISFTQDGKSFFIAANRKEGLGQLDIYKVTIGDETELTTIIQGIIFIGKQESAQVYNPDFFKVFVTVFDMNGNVFGRYEPTEDGQFFATLYPGKYKLEVKLDGSNKPFETIYTITDQGFLVEEIYLDPAQ